MQKSMLYVCILAVAVFLMVQTVAAGYRKPPFNGSIFGKRADYDGTGRALSSLCEIASEACSAWFPVADAN